MGTEVMVRDLFHRIRRAGGGSQQSFEGSCRPPLLNTLC